MLSSVHYLIRSKQDGQYLVARPNIDRDNSKGFLLIFSEQYDALSYLNTHAKSLSDRFAVESLVATQLKALLKRWGFEGIALVEDPLLLKIDFRSIDRQSSF